MSAVYLELLPLTDSSPFHHDGAQYSELSILPLTHILIASVPLTLNVRPRQPQLLDGSPRKFEPDFSTLLRGHLPDSDAS